MKASVEVRSLEKPRPDVKERTDNKMWRELCQETEAWLVLCDFFWGDVHNCLLAPDRAQSKEISSPKPSPVTM